MRENSIIKSRFFYSEDKAMKKWTVAVLVLAMMLTLTACGEAENAVFVQSVADLANMGGIAPGDKFPGMVVSENITEIQKDGQMVVEELLVKEGDDVTAGQELFRYDTQRNLRTFIELCQLHCHHSFFFECITDFAGTTEMIALPKEIAFN